MSNAAALPKLVAFERNIQFPLIHPEVFSNVQTLLERGAQDGTFPGGVLVVGLRGREIFKAAAGVRFSKLGRGDTQSPMTLETVFDVASLTNVMVTTALIMKLVEAGKLRLQDRISRYINNFGVAGKSVITVEQLLNHTSGLAPWHPFFEELLQQNAAMRMGIMTSRGAREYVLNSINRAQLRYAPGSRQVYSDIGVILLGYLAEAITGLSLDRAAHRFVFQPLGLRSTSYVDLALIRRRGIHPVRDLIAPTEECAWRQRVLCGEVHDDNAWAMGGIAGHSGVFSTAHDLHIFAVEMLQAYHSRSSYLRSETIHSFWEHEAAFAESAWRFGWDSPSRENGLLESKLSPQAVGINGFTGCSLWIEPALGLDIVLMSNRVHPSRANKKIRAYRPELFNAVIEAVSKLSL